MAISAAATKAAGLDVHLPRLASTWAAEHPERTWLEVDGTLVFADVSGFTALSERLARRGPIGAEELTEVLGRCFSDLLAVAYAEGGSLLKFGGDALLLLFDGAGHAGRSVRAALRMQSVMRRIGRDLTTSVGKVRLRMSVGAHTGAVHLFRVGTSHKELLVAGPTASTTIAMEGAADAGEIVVSPTLAALAGPRLIGPAKGGGVLLRMPRRVDPGQADTAFPARPVAGDGDTIDAIPVALREHLLGGAESEHRTATIAFVHFDGTDAIIHRDGPAVVVAALHELVGCVQAAADEHGVTFLGSDIDRDGGKIILASGAPRALGDDEGRLLRAARSIADAGLPLSVRIGVNRGRVFAGEVGPHYRRTYTVMGDAVNLAARLMAAAAPGQVLATADVLEPSRTAFETVSLPPFSVKGKTRPVQAFAVGLPLGQRATREWSRLPLIGRDVELAAVRSAVEDAAAGAGSIVEIVGEVGLGKTRLLEEMRTMAPDRVRIVSCDQYEQSTPWFAARVLLRVALGLPPGPTIDADLLRRRVTAVRADLVESLPLIGDVLNLAVPDTAATALLEPLHRRRRTSAVVAHLLAAAAGPGSVLAFDDTQWIDDASSDVVRHLAVRARSDSFVLCLARRPEGAAVEGGATARCELVLASLDDAAADALVEVAARRLPKPLDPARRAAIRTRGDGNPLFLEELVAIAASTDDEVLPSSLDGVVSVDLDLLAPIDRRVLRHASVLGSSFTVPLLVDVVGPELAPAVPASLARLGGHLRAHADGRLTFRHRLLRDVAYETLPFRLREQLHGRAAAAIERTVEAGAADRSAVLSLHHLHAKQYEACWRHARAAAAAAARTYAAVEAVTLYERAIAAARRLPKVDQRQLARTWRSLGEMLMLLGRFSAADAAFRSARRLVSDPLELVSLCQRHAQTAERTGRPLAATRWILRALRALEGRDDRRATAERADLLAYYAAVRQQLGHPKDALRVAQQAAAAAAASGNRLALAHAYVTSDWARISLGSAERPAQAYEALRIYERFKKPDTLASILLNLGAFAYFQGRWSEAVALYERANAASREAGALADAAVGSCNAAEIFADQGRLEEAARVLLDAISLYASLDAPVGIARATRYLARVELRRGDLVAARHHFEAARAAFASFDLPMQVLEMDVWLAECDLRAGAVDAAMTLLDDALRREEASGSSELRPMIHRLRGYGAAARGDLETAWAELDASLAVARSRGAAYDIALALEAESVLAELGGRVVDGEAEQERVVLLQQLGVLRTPAPPLPHRERERAGAPP